MTLLMKYVKFGDHKSATPIYPIFLRFLSLPSTSINVAVLGKCSNDIDFRAQLK